MQHIFFDNKADEGDDCVVDVRDIVSNLEIPYEKFIDMYVVKVDPIRAILEMDYFVKMIEKAEQKRDEEIQRAEAGIEDDEERKHVKTSMSTGQEGVETEWELI